MPSLPLKPVVTSCSDRDSLSESACAQENEGHSGDIVDTDNTGGTSKYYKKTAAAVAGTNTNTNTATTPPTPLPPPGPAPIRRKKRKNADGSENAFQFPVMIGLGIVLLVWSTYKAGMRARGRASLRAERRRARAERLRAARRARRSGENNSGDGGGVDEATTARLEDTRRRVADLRRQLAETSAAVSSLRLPGLAGSPEDALRKPLQALEEALAQAEIQGAAAAVAKENKSKSSRDNLRVRETTFGARRSRSVASDLDAARLASTQG